MRVIYSEAMNAPAQGYSPSAAKPAAVFAAWTSTWPALQVRPPQPASVDDLCRAHQQQYVEDVLALRRSNGFGTRNAAVAASLPYTSGALLTAAKWALISGAPVAAPVSGFHHAHWDDGGGFCTFNGLMVTALALRAAQPNLTVGILDYDFHYGGGTEDILEKVGRQGIVHITAGERWKDPGDGKGFMDAIPGHLEQPTGCGIVLYQAGADPHMDDPLGGFLTTAQLALRDWRVFDGLRQRGIPLAWDLAGGYQDPLSKVVAIHVNTMLAAVQAEGAG